MPMKPIYFDYAATTPADQEVAALMMDVMVRSFGNPSSVHGFGREALAIVAKARRQLAELIGARPQEIVYTSGGSESDNLALKGAAYACRQRGKHIVTTAVEHHALLHSCQQLEEQGFTVTYLQPDKDGRIDPAEVSAALRDETILISVMFANNEVGTVQPIREIGALARDRGIWFHTDAVQAVGHLPIDVAAMNIDLLSLSGHKFYGPKGIGALYVRSGIRLEPQIAGGAQERGLRAGTENVPAIAGLGLAAEKAQSGQVAEAERLGRLSKQLIDEIEAKLPRAALNGHRQQRLPGNVNFSFPGISGESLLLNLDMAGIAASSGSACAAGSLEPSHVLLAMGLAPELARSSLRISLGRENTAAEIEYLAEQLVAIVRRLDGLQGSGGWQ